jgi:hypothetical protein
MAIVTLTPTVLSLSGHDLEFNNVADFSWGVRENLIYAFFISPKKWAHAKKKAAEWGYFDIATDYDNYFFFHEGKNINDLSSMQKPISEVLADMPPVPNYTKYLGINLRKTILNQELKDNIDRLGLKNLETMLKTKKTVTLGYGVYIVMTDDYQVKIDY